jgi:Flp pilus assembly protein TadB
MKRTTQQSWSNSPGSEVVVLVVVVVGVAVVVVVVVVVVVGTAIVWYMDELRNLKRVLE